MGNRVSVGSVLGFLLCGLGAVGCRDKAPPPPAPPEVVVATPIHDTITRYAYFTGRTYSVADVSIRARVKGFLQSVHFQEGGMVRKGQLLFEIDPQEHQAAVDQAKADWEAAQAQEEKLKFNYERMEDAHATGVATDMEFADAKADYDRSVASVAQAKAAWSLANINLGYCRVLSPVAGKVSKRYVDVGNLVGSGEATLLATVIQQDPIYVYFDIDEKTWLEVHARSQKQGKEHHKDDPNPVFEAAVEDQKDYPYHGVLDYASNEVDPNTGTIEVRGILPNVSGLLLPGMFARVRIPYADAPGAMLIPDTAVGYDQTGSYVYVVDEKNQVQHVVIETGEKVGSLREVLKGLKDGDRIIIQGLLRARPGRPVAPTTGTFAPPKSASPPSSRATRIDEKELKALEQQVPTTALTSDLTRQPETLPTSRPGLLEGVKPMYQPDTRTAPHP